MTDGNVSRFAGRAGSYEVWYLTWNHPTTGDGYWLRYIIEAPLVGPPRGELWFARFDPHDAARTFGIHTATTFALETAPFQIRIGDARLTSDHARGELRGDGHAIEWDLRWDPAPTPVRPYPDLTYLRGGWNPTMFLCPNPRVPVSGTVTIDGETVRFSRSPLGQSHVWGKKHAPAWVWAHVTDWDDDSAALVEVICSRKWGVPVTLVALELDGELHRMNQFRHLVRNRSSWTTTRVELSAWSPSLRIEGVFTAAPSQMIACPYVDPDGDRLTCTNTEVGDATFSIFRRRGLRWSLDRTLTATQRAHFEVGSQQPDPAITTRHVPV